MNKAPALAAIALLVAGCGIADPQDAPPTADAPAKGARSEIATYSAPDAAVPRAQRPAVGGADDTDRSAERWSSYRDFWFDFGSTRLDLAENSKAADVASYLRENPSYRAALVKAGVPGNRIFTGEYGDARFRRERRVEVLVIR